MFELTEELKNYKGTNVKPADFDLYWQRALKLIENHDLEVELVPANIRFENAECFDLYFKGVDGSKIHAKYLRPTINKKDTAILQFHGYMYHSGYWNEKLVYTSQGYSVAAMDTRGQGGLSEDLVQFKGCTVYGHLIKGLEEHPDNLYYKYVFLDTVILSRIIMKLEKIENLYTMGLSQGGALALVCGALVPQVKKIAVQNPFLSDYKKVWQLGVGREQYRLIDFFRLFDPLHQREEEVFEKLGYIDVHNHAENIKGRVFMGTGVIDDICPISCQMAIYNNLKVEKSLKLYPDFGHEDMPYFWDESVMFFNEI